MALLETPTLKKITVAILALALVSWTGVGVYRFKTDREMKSLAPSPTISSQKSPYTEYTDEINQFFIKFPKVWELDLRVGSDSRAFALSPADEVRDIYPEVSLSIEENTEKLSVLAWIKVNRPDVEGESLQPIVELQLGNFKLDEASRSTVYVNDKDSSKMYIFSAYPASKKTTQLTDEGREKFVEVVSTFKFMK